MWISAICLMTSWRRCCFRRLQRVTREDVFLKQWLYCPQNYWYADIHKCHQNSCIKSIKINKDVTKTPSWTNFVWWQLTYFLFSPLGCHGPIWLFFKWAVQPPSISMRCKLWRCLAKPIVGTLEIGTVLKFFSNHEFRGHGHGLTMICWATNI